MTTAAAHAAAVSFSGQGTQRGRLPQHGLRAQFRMPAAGDRRRLRIAVSTVLAAVELG